jgi:phenylacetic acid degradation operon negative regulatory protein
LVPFVFAVAGRSELPGIALNRLLTDLGMSASAAKAMLARMRHRGQLATRRHGRGAEYRLAGPFEESFQRIGAGAHLRPSAWTGWFHALLYQVPETDRFFRDLLRRNAVLVGYGQLHQGVLIAMTDHTAALAGTLARQPASAMVYPAQLRLGLADARSAATHAWALADVARVLAAHCDELDAVLADVPDRLEPAAPTLRRYADIVNAPLIDTLLAPALPPELLPEQWPMGRLQDLINVVHQHYYPPATAYVQELLAHLSPG